MELGALILFANDLSQAVRFYQTLGVPLEKEDHEGGPLHFACELGTLHFAIFAGPPGDAPLFRTGGSVMPGFAVPSLDRASDAMQALGAKIIQPPTDYPWGPRMLVEDPDGRTVELFQRKP